MGRNERGFSLAELMITLVVVGIVIASVSLLITTIQRGQRETAYIEMATRAAQREIEVLRNNQYNQLEPGVDIDFTDDLPATLPGPKNGVVVVTEPTPGLRRVDVTVTYQSGGKQKSVELSSLIGVLGITQ
jgi:prepilin-type N-terminal cleavage/methylation domain-containing protein